MKAKQHQHKMYLIFSDYVIAKDGDKHLVSTRELIHLYGLDRFECIEIPIDYDGPLPRGEFIILKPRPNGDYKEYIELTKKRYNL